MDGQTPPEQMTLRFADDDARWEAVVQRDHAADGRFYYAVQTTGIYCQPSCGARLAHREHVRFYTTCMEAEQAGFRPCKRCRPQETSRATRQVEAVAAACRTLATADVTPSLDALAQSTGMSRYHFHRVFKAVTGMTPKAYATAQRAQRVRETLPQCATVTEAIYAAGFNSNGRFYTQVPDMLGMTPSAFRTGGTGVAMRFAVGECSLGSLLVAATDQGVCAILLGDDPEALVRDLQDRFPKAQLLGGDANFERLVATVVGSLKHRRAVSICRSTYAAPLSNSRSGRHCGLSQSAPPPATQTLRNRLGHHAPSAQSRRHAPPTISLWPFPAIAWYATTGRWPATVGALNASARSSLVRPPLARVCLSSERLLATSSIRSPLPEGEGGGAVRGKCTRGVATEVHGAI